MENALTLLEKKAIELTGSSSTGSQCCCLAIFTICSTIACSSCNGMNQFTESYKSREFCMLLNHAVSNLHFDPDTHCHLNRIPEKQLK